MTDLFTALKQHFGFAEFRPGQEEVMTHLLGGRSAAAVFPTGSGKSLCYQLPALLLPGITLVVSPLIALMKDQIDALAARGIAAKRLDSTLKTDEYRDVMQQLREGKLRLLYVAPERFQNERFREMIRQVRISLFAVDEAHCISEWGHNFRPDYLKLVEFAKRVHAERVLALTATATPQVLKDMCAAFAIEPECAIRTGFYRPNLTLMMTSVSAAERDSLLVRRLRERPPGPTVVYVTLQRTAEKVAEQLSAAGFEAKPYHAGLDDEVRGAVQDWFLQTRTGITVATIAFGMGVDKSNIRAIYHYNLPKSLENYSQEIGRSGRDAAPAICEMFVCLDDLNVLENFVLGDTPTLTRVREFVQEVFAQGPEFDVSYHDYSGRFDTRILVIRTLFTYLELDGYLEGGTPFYSEYKFKPIKTSQEILEQFEGERRDFLRDVLRNTRKAKTWCYIDLDQTAQLIKAPRDRVVRALDYLGEQGYLELHAEGVRHRYRRLKVPPDTGAIAADLHARAMRHEERELSRLNQVVELITHDGCQVNALCEHFGETRAADCGHCSWCLNQRRPIVLPERPRGTVDERVVRNAMSVLAQHSEVGTEPQVLARFLCGVTSPKFTRAKLSSHALFGSLSHIPFRDICAKV
jgi:ATP-dependent DNA helicase RecQ